MRRHQVEIYDEQGQQQGGIAQLAGEHEHVGVALAGEAGLHHVLVSLEVGIVLGGDYVALVDDGLSLHYHAAVGRECLILIVVVAG